MSDAKATFRERLHVPVRWWLQGALLVASFWLAMIVAVPEGLAWGISAALMALLIIMLGAYGRAGIRVDDGWLRAGRARIELRFVVSAQALDRAETRAVSGPYADARAYLLWRPYLPHAVRIEIDDPADPTPYWLVSSRHGEALASSLNSAQRAIGLSVAEVPSSAVGSSQGSD